MPTTTAVAPSAVYAETTESTHGASETAAPGGAAAAGPPGSLLSPWLCAGRPWPGWVPDHEADVVPVELHRVCARCGTRALCLVMGVGERGYWGGATTADRALLEGCGSLTPAAADAIRADRLAARSAPAACSHAPGEGSLASYRRHGAAACPECRDLWARARRERRARQEGTGKWGRL